MENESSISFGGTTNFTSALLSLRKIILILSVLTYLHDVMYSGCDFTFRSIGPHMEHK